MATVRADVTVREARRDDRGAMLHLLAELGYPADAETLDLRLDRLGGEPSAKALVAEREGEIVGLASLHVLHLIERPPLGRLSAIVVAESARRGGVGLALMERVEREARAVGCDRLEVTSGEWRRDAHAFYRELGFEETSKRFIKRL
jgi:N-acetylglutamate synthase-like GNAT family acetyltransferase